MAAEFRVLSTQPWDYTDQTGRLISGFRVFILLVKFDETHQLLTPTLDPAAIKVKAENLIKQRTELTTL